MELIDKATVMAEIERRINKLYDFLPDASKVENGSITTSEACNTGKYTALESFRRFVNTLEAKEVVTEQEGICNGILNRIIGDNWNLVIPLDKVGLKHGDKVKTFITKEE